MIPIVLSDTLACCNRWLARLLAGGLALALLAMSVTVLLQVYFRYIAQAPLPWSEELARYLLVMLTVLALISAFPILSLGLPWLPGYH